ncbi:DUF7500 family protein [Halorubrum sp. DTA98]|uniref:DUF7500 family protein n=1 Tax=Halorubrum sp. DTA98 TaxID=3402163 RepID=UPI003AAB3C65
MSDKEVSPADPDDLDFTDDERVAEIDEGRYVVGTDGRPNVRPSGSEPDSEPADDSGFETPAEPQRAAEREPTATGDASGDGAGSPDVDRQAVSRWLAGSFDDDGFAYGFDATLHAEGDTARHRMVSNDVTATFDTLVSWFASNAGTDAPPSEALGLLLMAADTPVDLPPVAIKRFAASHGLSATDSIGDLVRAAEEEGGFRIE